MNSKKTIVAFVTLIILYLSCVNKDAESDKNNIDNITKILLIEKSLNHNYLKDYYINGIPEPIYVYAKDKLISDKFKIKCFNKNVAFINNLDDILSNTKYKNSKNVYCYFQLLEYKCKGNQVFITLEFAAQGLFINAIYEYNNGKWIEKEYKCVET